MSNTKNNIDNNLNSKDDNNSVSTSKSAGKNGMSPILKVLTLPIAIFMICLGVVTILGGHITPGGGFQGGAMIAGGIIFCVLVYGVDKSPIQISHEFISSIETFGALAYIFLGLAGLFFGGYFLYNLGANIYGFVNPAIATLFKYPDVTNAGILPYLNIFVGIKVLVGLSAIVIAFSQFKKLGEEE